MRACVFFSRFVLHSRFLAHWWSIFCDIYNQSIDSKISKNGGVLAESCAQVMIDYHLKVFFDLKRIMLCLCLYIIYVYVYLFEG